MPKIKGMLISMDAAISLPIVSTAVLLLLYTFHTQTLSLTTISTNSVMQLKLYTSSQVIASFVDQYLGNSLSLSSFIENYSNTYYIHPQILSFSNFTPTACEGMTACRIVTLNGKSMILVLNYENAS